MSSTMMENQDSYEGKTTLVRRVSDLFKAEGNKSERPILLRHTSMQKLRHCCQNLNLFPYLLYSVGNQKVYPMPMMKINICLGLLLARITERIYRVNSSLRHSIIRGLRLASKRPSVHTTPKQSEKIIVNNCPAMVERETRTKPDEEETARNFAKFTKQKPKRNPLFLKLAVYLAPFVLALQLVGIFSLMAFGKYTPGFVFLVTALIFLGCISMKVLNHDTSAANTFKREKRKVE